jgi:hypothetical protein
MPDLGTVLWYAGGLLLMGGLLFIYNELIGEDDNGKTEDRNW